MGICQGSNGLTVTAVPGEGSTARVRSCTTQKLRFREDARDSEGKRRAIEQLGHGPITWECSGRMPNTA